ncbi:MAG: endolytic transglycosylase MltG [Limnobacter sp.]|nr:endolytic transglycosylase MltG [Limnobacter sp.]
MLIRLFTAAFALLGCLLAAGFWLLTKPIPQDTSQAKPRLDAHVTQGLGARGIAEELNTQGLGVNPDLFALAARLSGAASSLKAGRYELPKDISTLELVDFLSQGKGVLSSITLVEGFTSAQFIAQLKQRPDLIDDLVSNPALEAKGVDLSQQIGRQLGLEGGHLEGWLFPDTYRYAPGSQISDLIKRAVRLQTEELNKAWSQRDPNTPLKTPYQALVMASIVEKETGKASDRPKVSSVFNNRLKVGMMLQTDPTVIYGVGAAFDGNLTRRHLQTDTPYNSYTRTGLPPTPIANPSKASLYAAVRPEETPYYYFVAQGDGGSYFSKNLNEHNQAVRKYQLGR